MIKVFPTFELLGVMRLELSIGPGFTGRAFVCGRPFFRSFGDGPGLTLVNPLESEADRQVLMGLLQADWDLWGIVLDLRLPLSWVLYSEFFPLVIMLTMMTESSSQGRAFDACLPLVILCRVSVSFTLSPSPLSNLPLTSWIWNQTQKFKWWNSCIQYLKVHKGAGWILTSFLTK